MALESFQPAVRRWFQERLGEPTPAQARGWPRIRAGAHVLIAAPTGSGKTLAAFLSALDGLFAQGATLPDETRVLYVSPLKALSNDVQKNLAGPLAEIRALDPALPEVRVLVRTGDTPARERVTMLKAPPHVLVTTPESLYILLTSAGGRKLLRTVRTVIVDEIHAVLGDKRGAHLALSLERLSALAREHGEVQRIGLSATQRPLVDVGRFLVGVGARASWSTRGTCATWTSRSRSRPRRSRRSARTRPGRRSTRASPSTCARTARRWSSSARASWPSARRRSWPAGGRRGRHLPPLEPGQGAPARRRAAAQGRAAARAGRDGLARARHRHRRRRPGGADRRAALDRHAAAAHRTRGTRRRAPAEGLPLPADARRVGRRGARSCARSDAASSTARRSRRAARHPGPAAVAACAGESWDESELFELCRRAWPYRELERSAFDSVVALHAQGRRALLHRAQVEGSMRLRGTRRAALAAITSGGAIPDSTQYRVVLEPDGTHVGAVDEDFAVEASGGDVFQLGATSWRVLRVERGTMRVADAHGVPPSLPSGSARRRRARASCPRPSARCASRASTRVGSGASAA
jgi:ATP-dependent Lhr-like helicase